MPDAFPFPLDTAGDCLGGRPIRPESPAGLLNVDFEADSGRDGELRPLIPTVGGRIEYA
jgi:hypothetical protein